VRALPRAAIGFTPWPNTAAHTRLAERASRKMSLDILQLFWRAIAALRTTGIPAAFVAGRPVERERAIAMAVCMEMQRLRRKRLSFSVHHETWEFTSVTRSRRPPQPDIGISLLGGASPALWPIEFKLASTDRQVAPYVKELRGSFLTCRYAADSAEGAIVACLGAGSEDAFLANVAARLAPVPFRRGATHRPSARYHQTSTHRRKVPSGRPYKATVRCHHLVVRVG
jgi:hypothetical protein